MRTAFVNALLELAENDKRIFLITADLGYSVLEVFRNRFPDRFLNVGIAEQNAIGVAAGLCLSGMIPYVYSIIPFVTMRCFEQIRVDVAYMNLPVRIVGVGAGWSYGPAGSTHHAIEDIAIMRALPNMTVCCPGDPVEARELVMDGLHYNGPIYYRLGKNGEQKIHSDQTEIKIGKGILIKKGIDCCLISTSNMLEVAYAWSEENEKEGYSTALISMPTVKPLDRSLLMPFIEQHVPMFSLEEHNVIGGLGSAIAEVIAENGSNVHFRRIGIPDVYVHEIGSQMHLRKKYMLDSRRSWIAFPIKT